MKARKSYNVGGSRIWQHESMSLIGINIRRLMAERGIGPSDMARLLGIKPQAISQWGKKTSPKSEYWAKIADALNCSIEDLMSAVPDTEKPVNRMPEKLPPSNFRFASDARAMPTRASMERNVPIYGTSQGGDEGVFHINREGAPIDWARRPAGLEGINKAFAIYVEGDSMKPWRKPGELVYAHESRAPDVGDHVIVVVRSPEPGEEPRAWVKQLVRRTGDKLVLAQYNPPKEITIEIKRVDKIHRVYEWSELLGA